MTESSDNNKMVTSAGYSVTVRLKITNTPGQLGPLIELFAEQKASIAEIVLVYSDFTYNIRDFTLNCRSEEHSQEIVKSLEDVAGCSLLKWQDDTFECHIGGKLEVVSRTEIKTRDALSRAYTPGVARVCSAIHKTPEDAFKYTIKSNCIAVVTDGSAVLGLGNIGPTAALPVMEGKAMLFKEFGGLDAFPICLDTQDTEEIIKTVKYLAPNFAGVNLEDIGAPACFEVENRLRAELDIPVFHDDQHGTAAVVLAGLINAVKLTGKNLESLRVVINGFGAGGVACTRMLLGAGIKNIIPCDSVGAVYRGRKERMNPVKEEVIAVTNPENLKGSVADALKGADVFIGVSQPGSITREMVKSMAKDPIVFALANPIPEIFPEEISDIAAVIATGRSDYANQVNNVLCFPGLFRGAVDCRATDISDQMKIASAQAIADEIKDDELNANYIIPSVFRSDVSKNVAARVKEVAIKEGIGRVL